MKSRDSLIRLKRFQVDEKRRRVAQIETMIAEFGRMTADLDREIATEERRSGIADVAHFAYSTYARASRARRDNLSRSTDELRAQLEEAKALQADAAVELEKAQTIDGRDKADRAIDLPRERSDLGLIGLRVAGA